MSFEIPDFDDPIVIDVRFGAIVADLENERQVTSARKAARVYDAERLWRSRVYNLTRNLPVTQSPEESEND